MSLKFLGIAGSLRQKSTNKGLLRAAQASLPSG
jgi:chromate reductase